MSNMKDLAKIIGSPESERLEYKAVLPPARSLAQLIAAFANSEGGLIILGVNDASGEIKITGLSEDFHANGVTHKAIDLLSPKPEVHYEYITQEGKRLYVIQVKKSQSAIAVENKIYVRKGHQNILSNPEVRQASTSQLP
jgi:predicted HTH transcriptional regulator